MSPTTDPPFPEHVRLMIAGTERLFYISRDPIMPPACVGTDASGAPTVVVSRAKLFAVEHIPSVLLALENMFGEAAPAEEAVQKLIYAVQEQEKLRREDFAKGLAEALAPPPAPKPVPTQVVLHEYVLTHRQERAHGAGGREEDYERRGIFERGIFDWQDDLAQGRVGGRPKKSDAREGRVFAGGFCRFPPQGVVAWTDAPPSTLADSTLRPPQQPAPPGERKKPGRSGRGPSLPRCPEPVNRRA